MVRVLLDTCVLSELRPPGGNAKVHERVAELDSDSLFLSVITIGEFTMGIELLPSGTRKRGLASWLLALEQQYAEHVLPVDMDVTRIWGEVTARAQMSVTRIPASDGLIAATALRPGLHIMTRNTKDFTANGAQIIDPWES